MNNQRTTSSEVTHCAGYVLANSKPHQLCWVDREMGTAVSCTECSQVASLIQMVGESSSKALSLCATVCMCMICVCKHNLKLSDNLHSICDIYFRCFQEMQL